MPTLGEQARCAACDAPIVYKDPYWDHLGENKPRHIAQPKGAARPRIVCLCGSTRFYDAFQQANFEETMAGRIVLSVGFYAGSPGDMAKQHGEGVGITPEQKQMLDQLHLRKIDLADEVLVLNVGGYVGESTAREIAYAHSRGTPVRFLES